MSSWSNIDAAANAPLWAAMTQNLSPLRTNITNVLYANTTANNVASTNGDGSIRNLGKNVGLFNVDAQETNVENLLSAPTEGHIAHAGWNLVTTGTGGRSGRVQTETLVALANVINDGDAQIFANVAIYLAGPSNATVNSSGTFVNTATFTVTPTLTGNTAAALSYQWQYNTGAAWANIPANTAAIHWSGATTATLLAQPATTANNGTILRVVVTAADEGVVATSANATLSVPA